MGFWWLVPLSYLAGSVPWGLVIVRVVKRVDVRDSGSGSTGTTNVLRTAGRTAAVVVLIADAGKGVAMVLLARALTENEAVHAAVAGAVIVGHIWPVFAGFRGGRGIATGMASAAGLDPWMALVGFMVFLPTVYLTRYVSLGSVLGVLAVVITFGVLTALDIHPLPYLWYALVCGSLIIWMHRANIRRVFVGTERRIGRGTG